MNLHLFLQSELFLAPSEWLSPLLGQQLGRAERQQHHGTFQQQLCLAHGVSAEASAPYAAIRHHGEGLPDDGAMYFWVYPVHLQLQRDFFSLAGTLKLNSDEMQAITDALNQHFAQEGLQFTASQDGQGWYLRSHQCTRLVATEIEGMLGQAVPSQLVQGDDAEHWHRLHNEMQMLLFSHPVNQARESQGLLPINSLWLAGGGRLPARSTSAYTQLFSEDALSRGLASLAGLSLQALPLDLNALLAHPNTSNRETLLVLPKTVGNTVAQRLDMDECWVKPLVSALRTRKVRSAKVTIQEGRHAVTYTLSAFSTFKFWRASR